MLTIYGVSIVLCFIKILYSSYKVYIILSFQKERELEVSQASLAVANAASILSDQDTTGGKPFSQDFTNSELNELQQSKMALSSLQEEVQSLRAQNSALRSELTQVG